MEYTLFETSWGFCGFIAEQSHLIRFCLPVNNKATARKRLLEGIDQSVKWNPSSMKSLQLMVRRYFKGYKVDFSNVNVGLNGFPAFSRQILRACRRIPYGKIVTYERLARMAGKPRAIRAAASVLANNPIPLIIPCHRVIRKDGGWGGFSAVGGIKLKERLFQLEK